MKLVLSSVGPDLNAQIDPRFGRCEWLVTVDSDSLDFDCSQNPAITLSQGAGIQAAQFVVDSQAEALVTGHVGPNAFQVIDAAGIKIYEGTGLTVQQAIEKINNGSLREITKAGPAKHGLRAGRGHGHERP